MATSIQAQSLPRLATARRAHYVGAWITIREAFYLALDTLRAHKLRTFLTLLGVVIATTTLIVVMSVINGMNLYIANTVANLGANVFVLSQFKWASGEEEWLKARRWNKPIRIEDYDFLKDRLEGQYKNIGASAGMWGSDPPDARYKGRTIEGIGAAGVTPSAITIGTMKVENGRFFSETDYEHASMVCFIGQDVVDNFFANVDPIGKVIDVGGHSFAVIGTAQRMGTVFGQTQDNFIEVPLTAFARTFMARPRINVDVQAWDAPQMARLTDEVRALMRVRRHLQYSQDDNFAINSADALMGVWTELTGNIFAVAVAIVAVFMVVGGIVIMNIMLASVTERTHEIGIRKSLGARQRDILLQFLIEAAVMSCFGGLLGVVFAIGIARLVDIVFTASVPASAIIVGLLLSTVVGLVFGVYPARRAARLNPIEALRTEN